MNNTQKTIIMICTILMLFMVFIYAYYHDDRQDYRLDTNCRNECDSLDMNFYKLTNNGFAGYSCYCMKDNIPINVGKTKR